jgi:hypothetical protein
LYAAFEKHCNGVQSSSEMKVWNKAQDEGEKKERSEERKERAKGRRSNTCCSTK